MSAEPSTYIRFSNPTISATSKSARGFFQYAFDLIESSDAPSYILEGIQEEIDWFTKNLDEPPLDCDPCFEEFSPRAISWFKPSAIEHIKHTWDLVNYLEEAGVKITMVKSKNPGAVIWEDDHQVLAKPWRKYKDGRIGT